jgi:hypothetical protein
VRVVRRGVAEGADVSHDELLATASEVLGDNERPCKAGAHFLARGVLELLAELGDVDAQALLAELAVTA